MSLSSKDTSARVYENIPSAADMKFAVIVAEWNSQITENLYSSALETLKSQGANEDHIYTVRVPGSFELTSGARFFAEDKSIDAVICLGCVIQGETRHFEFICQAVANGLTQLSVVYNKPFIFGVLTTDNLQQALDRAGGKHGNKGAEAAVTAIKMVQLKKQFS